MYSLGRNRQPSGGKRTLRALSDMHEAAARFLLAQRAVNRPGLRGLDRD